MKIIITFLLFGFTLIIYAQKESVLRLKLSKLYSEREIIFNRLNEMDNKILSVEHELKTLEVSSGESPIYLRTINKANLREDASAISSKIATVPWGDRVKVIGAKNSYLKIEHHGKIGYIIKIDVEDVAKAKEKLLNQIKRKKIKEDNRKKIIKMFGKVEGAKIADEKVWIGMTDRKALHSWGAPRSINKTITSRGSDEQWVYGDGSYLYFENGKLTVIQQSK